MDDLLLDAHAWEHHQSADHLPWAVRVGAPAASFRASTTSRRIDDVTVLRWSSGPFAARRGARQIAATGDDHVVVDVVDDGRLSLQQGRRDARLGAGEAVAWDSRRPVRLEVPGPVAVRRLVIRRRVLDDVGCHLRTVEPTGEVPAVRVLRGYLDSLDLAGPELSGAPAVAARNALLELVWGALQPATALDPDAVAPARRAAVDRYLDVHLGQPGLSPEEVAAAHNISLRTLGRLFHSTGDTFSGVVGAKRLARAREDLIAGDTTVTALARRWGFVDASHLSRRFRGAHGVSPHEYRVHHRRVGTDPDGRHVPDRGPEVPVPHGVSR